MVSTEQRMGALAAERAAIARSGRLHWIHWAAILLSLALSVFAWQFSKQQVEQTAAGQFKRAADQVLELVAERMRKYELALWAGVSAIQANGGDIDREAWRVFAENLRIDVQYPGINGIGVIHNVPPASVEAYLEEQRRTLPDYNIHPEHDETVFMPITYIEPVDKNAAAVGLDMAHEANRYRAATRARDTGRAQITSPIVLVQDAGRTPGFLFFAPFYRGETHSTVNQRREHFTGMVYAPFVFHKLMEGTLEKEKRQVRIRVSEGETVLYDEMTEADPEIQANPGHVTKLELNLYGKTWRFDIAATRSFAAATTNDQPTLVLVGGILIECLLIALFVTLAKANRRAVDFADRMTSALQERTEQLEKSNAELEKFAYVTSHDLKTPLRGISALTEYLEEDLESYLSDPDANPDVSRNLQRLGEQTRRMAALIRGILDYSGIGMTPPEAGYVESAEVIDSLRSDLGLQKDQMHVEGTFPSVTIDVVRFQQVLGNLIGNAVKYHHDPSQMKITVTAEEGEDFYLFSVSDNGPGIDPCFHERIFEVFQTLQTKDDVESTGIGLSVVKKAVECHGGRVQLTSAPGEGTTFTFQWPKGQFLEEKKAA